MTNATCTMTAIASGKTAPRIDPGKTITIETIPTAMMILRIHGPVGKAHALAGAVVEEAHNGIPGLLSQDLAAVEQILVLPVPMGYYSSRFT